MSFWDVLSAIGVVCQLSLLVGMVCFFFVRRERDSSFHRRINAIEAQLEGCERVPPIKVIAGSLKLSDSGSVMVTIPTIAAKARRDQ
mgnify:CR=1 FL=1